VRVTSAGRSTLSQDDDSEALSRVYRSSIHSVADPDDGLRTDRQARHVTVERLLPHVTDRRDSTYADELDPWR
jgi:hypothetical protein